MSSHCDYGFGFGSHFGFQQQQQREHRLSHSCDVGIAKLSGDAVSESGFANDGTNRHPHP